jgi:CTP:molybdopterin cytidylyltransferase MocA
MVMSKNKDLRPKTNPVAAIILAAGRSRRMGAFKPLLPFGSTTVIEACIENICSGGVETVVVVLGKDPQAEELKTQLQHAGVLFAVNRDRDSEMSASIACGVRALPEGIRVVLINPADHAAVPGEVIRLLLDEWQQGARLVKPTWNNHGGHPVLIDLEFRAELLNLDTDGGLKRFFSERDGLVKRVEVKSNYIARDMDTWDDYVALHMEVFSVAAPELPPKAR